LDGGRVSVSQLKRSVVGRSYLPLCIAAACFGYNSRTNPAIFGVAVATA
jgi:hypothetical protein